MYGQQGDEYYYVDERGNLIEPAGPDERRVTFPAEGEQPPAEPPRRPDPRAPAPGRTGAPPPAASDEFLDEATGRDEGAGQ
jgi:penicillin-binding protein 1A